MRKITLYICLLLVASLVPVERADLGKLKPVETVYLGYEENQIVIATDLEDVGYGETLEDALSNLKETTAGIVYLDTADYLLVSTGAESQISRVAGKLKESVYICRTVGEVDLARVGSYLSVHLPKYRLKDWEKNVRLEELSMENERFRIK